MHVEPFAGGRCEAGSPAFKFKHYPPCDRRGRWMVDGVLLCGTCKRRAEREALEANDNQRR